MNADFTAQKVFGFAAAEEPAPRPNPHRTRQRHAKSAPNPHQLGRPRTDEISSKKAILCSRACLPALPP